MLDGARLRRLLADDEALAELRGRTEVMVRDPDGNLIPLLHAAFDHEAGVFVIDPDFPGGE
jgi:hypothetical protein